MAYKLQNLLSALWQDNVQQSGTELEIADYPIITPGAAISISAASETSTATSTSNATAASTSTSTAASLSNSRSTSGFDASLPEAQDESLSETQDELAYVPHSNHQDEWDPYKEFSICAWLGTAHQCLNVQRYPQALHSTLQQVYAENTPESAFYQSVLLTEAFTNIENARYPTKLIPLTPHTTSNHVTGFSSGFSSDFSSGIDFGINSISSSDPSLVPSSVLSTVANSEPGQGLGAVSGLNVIDMGTKRSAQIKSQDSAHLTLDYLLGSYHYLSFVIKRCEFLSPKFSDFLIKLRDKSVPVLYWTLRKLALNNKVIHPQFVTKFMQLPFYETLPCDALRYWQGLIFPGFYFEEGHFAYTDWMLKELFLRVAGPFALIESDWAIPDVAKWALTNSPKQTLHISTTAWDYPAILKAHVEAASIDDVFSIFASLRFQNPALARQLFVQYFTQIPQGSKLVEMLEVNLTCEDEDVLLRIIRNDLCAESALNHTQVNKYEQLVTNKQATKDDDLTLIPAEANSKAQQQARKHAWQLLTHICGGQFSRTCLHVLQSLYVYQIGAWIKQDVIADLDNLGVLVKEWLKQGLIDSSEYELGSKLIALLKRDVTTKRRSEFEAWLRQIEIKLLWCLDLDDLMRFTQATSNLEAIHRLLQLFADNSWETKERSAFWVLPQKILDARDSQAAEDLLIRSKLMFPELNLKDKFELMQSLMPLIWLLPPTQRTMVGWHLLDEMQALYTNPDYKLYCLDHRAPFYRDDNEGVYAPSPFSWCTIESGGQANDFVPLNELTLIHKFLEQPELNFASYKIANGGVWDNAIASSLALTLPFSEIDWLEQEILSFKQELAKKSESQSDDLPLKRHIAFLQRIQKYLKLKQRADELLRQELANAYIEDSQLPSLQPRAIKQLQQRVNQRVTWLN